MSDNTSITIDPLTGRRVTCHNLRTEAEACFSAAYESGDPRGRLARCYARARHVVRVCGLGVRVYRRRER
jgi:hypothetical protein